MLNAQTLAKIRPKALLINSARGEIIDESALLAAINQKQLSVVLDVFPNEPFISQQLLYALKLATPHIAGYTLEGKIRGTDMIYQAFAKPLTYQSSSTFWHYYRPTLIIFLCS